MLADWAKNKKDHIFIDRLTNPTSLCKSNILRERNFLVVSVSNILRWKVEDSLRSFISILVSLTLLGCYASIIIFL